MPETLQPIMMKTGEGLSVTTLPDGQRLTLVVGMKTEADCILHWGLSRRPGAPWRRPPDAFWPQGTTPAEGPAVRTPFAATNQGQKEVAIHFDLPCPESNLAFVVHFPRENRWLKSGGKDFSVPLPNGHHGPSPEEALAAWVPEEDAARQVFTLESGDRMATATRVTAEGRKVTLVTEAEAPLDLHWGVVWHFRHEWKLPPEDFRPAGTTVFQQEAARTPFTERDGLRFLEVNFPTLATGEKPRGMKFILLQPETGSWLKSGGKEIYLPLFESEGDSRLPSSKLRDLAEQIVGAEMGAGSWTLMHRFHLCHDLLEAAQDDEEALALLFTWLRYSSIRQLDWQRRFNTKPRELSHAQDRLTTRLAGVWRRHLGPDGAGRQVWARRLLTTLGRGGDGQRVRDEILQIMHRNHLKETSGQFIEEWHQKLHNNTTPDDVVLCEAYLAFLSSNGNRDLFYQTLEKGGVTRDRLRSFERPIKTDPDFYADRKNALIPEFENFLRILKSVHAGTDLESAAAAARPRLNEGQKQKLDHLLWLRSRNPGVKELAGTIVSVRESLREALLAIKDDAGLRDLLYLDLALEESFRGAIERQNLSQFGRDDLVELVQWALRNLDLSTGLPELSLCGGHWAQLLAQPRAGREWALHAKSVADRAGRCVQGITDELYRVLQPK
ncbi:MAG: hypothetical protein JO112_03485, partial [Planctomycetes bacterium]|nr:hypothetical protein [Planctomycetota bacterium]